jgi:facilitated trehalose transporter
MKMNNLEKASKSITFYCIDRDLKLEQRESNIFIENKDSQNMKNAFTEFKLPFVRESMVLIIFLFALPHLSGMVTLMSYMEIILNTGEFNLINSQHCVIYANIISVVTTILTLKLIDKYGRKILLLISSIGIIISLLALATYFYLLHNEVHMHNLQWLLITSILLHLISFSVGYSRVPSTVLSEIFSEKIKNVAACVSTLSACFFAFLTLKAYQPLVDALGEGSVFLIYASLTLIGTIWVFFLLPETKGKSLQEIQNELMKKN